MVEKSELRLGQHVVVRLCGGETVGAVVDGLCNDWVGVRLDRGGYVIADWEDVDPEVVNDLDGIVHAVWLPDGRIVAEDVIRTEQGEVLAEKKVVECDGTVHKLLGRAWVTPDDEKEFTESVYGKFVDGQKVVISIKG